MTAPQPYPGDPEAPVAAQVGPNLNRTYRDPLGRPLVGRVIVTPSVGPSFELIPLEGAVVANLAAGRYTLVADLRDADGKAHYQTEVVNL